MDKSVWQGKTILVVEDDKALQDAIVMKLGREGINTVTARSYNDAIAAINRAQTVDAIWLDHYLIGEQDGYAIVAEIKKNPKWNEIPVFLVSNTINPDKVKPYFDAGILKFYVKSDYWLEEILTDIKQLWFDLAKLKENK